MQLARSVQPGLKQVQVSTRASRCRRLLTSVRRGHGADYGPLVDGRALVALLSACAGNGCAKTHGSLCVSCCVVIINLSYHGTAYHSKHVPTAVPVPWYLRYLPYIPTYTNIPYVHRSQLANCTPCDESALCLSYLRTGKESAQPPWFHNACDNSFFSSR